ncbi:hypothetical protein B0H19DRAFT_1267853 [Mycena capillaripes]|nr:hypothetical protein B0H19DRAFT_1267853 [Mycena capillaripes]
MDFAPEVVDTLHGLRALTHLKVGYCSVTSSDVPQNSEPLRVESLMLMSPFDGRDRWMRSLNCGHFRALILHCDSDVSCDILHAIPCFPRVRKVSLLTGFNPGPQTIGPILATLARFPAIEVLRWVTSLWLQCLDYPHFEVPRSLTNLREFQGSAQFLPTFLPLTQLALESCEPDWLVKHLRVWQMPTNTTSLEVAFIGCASTSTGSIYHPDDFLSATSLVPQGYATCTLEHIVLLCTLARPDDAPSLAAKVGPVFQWRDAIIYWRRFPNGTVDDFVGYKEDPHDVPSQMSTFWDGEFRDDVWYDLIFAENTVKKLDADSPTQLY